MKVVKNCNCAHVSKCNCKKVYGKYCIVKSCIFNNTGYPLEKSLKAYTEAQKPFCKNCQHRLTNGFCIETEQMTYPNNTCISGFKQKSKPMFFNPTTI